MKKEKIKQGLIIAGGAVLTANAIAMAISSNMNAGIIFTFALGLVLMFFGFLPQEAARKIPKWLKRGFFGGIAALLACVVFLLSFGLHDTAKGSEDAIIVLGSGIRGETLTVGLKNRLDEAIELFWHNDNAVIVVSGGQGPQESITEALAMERYLLLCGIPQEKIIKEEQATSTYENFLYSKEILDEYFGGEYEICFVSNEYHIFRASFLAKNAGFAEMTHSHSSTLFYTVLPSCFRECMAVVKMIVLGK